jgi:hypothetical protein
MLTEETIRLLVLTTLPGAVRIGNEHRNPRLFRELLMFTHFLALIID